MYKIMLSFLIALLPLICSGQAAVLQRYLEIQRQRIHFNGVVFVTKDNQVLHRMNIGKASFEQGIAMDSGQVFKIASVSKQFTAMLVALAAEEGKLRLDDSLGTFFPSLMDPQWRKISIHQLLSHTSGIPHNEGIADYWTVKSRLPLSKDQVLKEIFDMKLLFEPGTKMHYSSPGYGLLACILEKTYGKPFAQILEEKILQPLQLKHTGVNDNSKIIPGMVSAYHVQGDSLRIAPYRDFSLMRGSGDLYTSAEDLALWNSSFSPGGHWNEALKTSLFSSYTTGTPAYGYGWFIRTQGRPAYYHGGGTFGCSALSAWYPRERMSIIILSNVSVLPVNELWNDIEKIVFNEPIEFPTLRSGIRLDTEHLRSLAGRYKQEQNELNILLINGQLYAKLGANPAFEIFAESNMTFFGKKVNVRILFKSNETDGVIGLEANVRGQLHQFIKQ